MRRRAAGTVTGLARYTARTPDRPTRSLRSMRADSASHSRQSDSGTRGNPILARRESTTHTTMSSRSSTYRYSAIGVTPSSSARRRRLTASRLRDPIRTAVAMIASRDSRGVSRSVARVGVPFRTGVLRVDDDRLAGGCISRAYASTSSTPGDERHAATDARGRPAERHVSARRWRGLVARWQCGRRTMVVDRWPRVAPRWGRGSPQGASDGRPTGGDVEDGGPGPRRTRWWA